MDWQCANSSKIAASHHRASTTQLHRPWWWWKCAAWEHPRHPRSLTFSLRFSHWGWKLCSHTDLMKFRRISPKIKKKKEKKENAIILHCAWKVRETSIPIWGQIRWRKHKYKQAGFWQWQCIMAKNGTEVCQCKYINPLNKLFKNVIISWSYYLTINSQPSMTLTHSRITLSLLSSLKWIVWLVGRLATMRLAKK